MSEKATIEYNGKKLELPAVIGSENEIGLDIEYVVSRIGIRAKLEKLELNEDNIRNIMMDIVSSQCREHAEDAENFLLSLDIETSTKILREFKKEDSKNYFEWAKLLKSKEIFKKIVAHLEATGEIKEK